MLHGEIDINAGVIAGLDGCAAWVADAAAGRLAAEIVAQQAPKVVNHLAVYLQHEAAMDHANRTTWEAALASANLL